MITTDKIFSQLGKDYDEFVHVPMGGTPGTSGEWMFQRMSDCALEARASLDEGDVIETIAQLSYIQELAESALRTLSPLEDL